MNPQDKNKPGPEPERLKIVGEWKKAVGKALKSKKNADETQEVKKPTCK